jgi:hypothetical protein
VIPTKTIEKIGVTTWRGINERGADKDEYYMIRGQHLNELTALAHRMDFQFNDGDEKRDWQNLINLIVHDAKGKQF